MKELMLRLIREGKIVGYEWRKHGRIYHNRKPVESTEMRILQIREHSGFSGNFYFPNYIEHDSFDLGIKVGDDGDWFFSGDYIRAKYIDGHIYEGELRYDGLTWIVEFRDGKSKWLGDTQFDYASLQSIERIGTIHDEETKD